MLDRTDGEPQTARLPPIALTTSTPSSIGRTTECRASDATNPADRAARPNAAATPSADHPSATSPKRGSLTTPRAPPPRSRTSQNAALDLFRRLPDLPERDLRLLVELPELARLYHALTDDDVDRAEELLAPVLERIDTLQARARLADAVADLHAAERIDPLVAAAAHIDLDSDSELLITASLIHAAALAAGATRTPGGLVLAA
jgi:hypothetical protein